MPSTVQTLKEVVSFVETLVAKAEATHKAAAAMDSPVHTLDELASFVEGLVEALATRRLSSTDIVATSNRVSYARDVVKRARALEEMTA